MEVNVCVILKVIQCSHWWEGGCDSSIKTTVVAKIIRHKASKISVVEELFLINTWSIFVGFYFCWNYFSQKKSTSNSLFDTAISSWPPHPPQVNHDINYFKITKKFKDNKRTKTKIGLVSIVKVNIVDMVENKKHGRIRRTRKYVVKCLEAVMGKKKFLVQL